MIQLQSVSESLFTLNDTIYYEIISTSLCFEDMQATNGIAGNMVYNK